MSTTELIGGLHSTAVEAMIARERTTFIERRPRSRALHEQSSEHWLNGVPMHWMSDWSLPFPLTVAHASGAILTDADRHSYADFCLGDTGAMFGHSPEAVARAVREQSARGLTYMLPTEQTAHAGELLTKHFGLPYWQLTQTATEANRAVIRWSRAITHREKIAVFDGAYHGAVDDTFVRLDRARVIPRPGQIGRVIDYASYSRVVEFNDVSGLEQALRHRDVACLLAEPVMTNAGMVLPEPEFWQQAKQLCDEHGTLLAMDETHTLSSGPGGHSRHLNLDCDFMTLGKAIAGGIPCGAYGFTAAIRDRMIEVLANKSAGHSGMGTTLAANAVATAALVACLEHVMTPVAYAHMTRLADHLSNGLRQVIEGHGLRWHVVQVGARVEFSFREQPARTASESLAAMNPQLEHAIHLYLLNRAVLITPFHNMMLTSPMTEESHVHQLLTAFNQCCDELRA